MAAYTDCSYEYLRRSAHKLGFFIFEGKRHCKVKDVSGRFITIIPRHNRIKRETARGIIEDFITRGGISREKIEKVVRC